MDYMLEVVAFEEWFETHSLSISAQLLWHKLMYLNYKNGWDEWVQLDNKSLMKLIEVKNESTLIKIRKELVEADLIEYQMGKKGNPSRYKIKSILEEKGEIAAAMSEEEPSVAVGEINKEEAIKSTAEVSSIEELKLFEKFWEVYPRRKAKTLAEQNYKDLILHTAGVSEAKILAAAKNYAKECKKNKTKELFTKMAHNWLKDLVWVDYLPENYKEQESGSEQEQKGERITNNRFNNIEQRMYDFDELEKVLLGG